MEVKIKGYISIILCMTMGVCSLSGCSKDDDREPTEQITIACPVSNEEAMVSPTNVALRYFYLINEYDYDSAYALLDTDNLYCSADLLGNLYKTVRNYKFKPTLRAIDCYSSSDSIENGGTGVVTITFADISQTAFVEQSYAEGEEPAWYGLTEPYVDSIAFSENLSITDMDGDGVISQYDMELEDEELNSIDDDIVDEVTMKTSSIRTELLSDSSADTTDEIVNSELNEVSEVSSADTTDEVVNNELSGIYVSENISVYDTYVIDITVKNIDGKYYVCLPENMLSDDSVSVKLKVPSDMVAYLNGVKLSEDLMDLNDTYTITNLPMHSTATLLLESKVDESYAVTLDLEKRVYYIYDYILPTRQCKNSALEFADDAILQLYTSLSNGENYTDSSFINKYVSKDANTASFKDYYDKAIIDKCFYNNTFSIVDVLIPENSDMISYDNVRYSDLKIDNGNYLTLPVVVTLSRRIPADDTADSDTIDRVTVDGSLYLTKDNGEWKVWSFDSTLMINDEGW